VHRAIGARLAEHRDRYVDELLREVREDGEQRAELDHSGIGGAGVNSSYFYAMRFHFFAQVG